MNAKKLDELCDFINGLWTGKKPPYVNVGVIRNTNFTKGGELDFTDIAQLDVEIKQFSTRQLKFGDIVLEKSGGGPKQPVGRACVFEKNEGLYSLSNFTSAVRVKNPDELYYKYLHYFLIHLYFSGQTEKIQTNSTGIRNLQLSLYKEFFVPLPSIEIQKSVVSRLSVAFSKIDEAISCTEKNIKNAEAYFYSFLNSALDAKKDGWKEIVLKDACKFVNRGISPSYVDEGGVLVLNQKCVRNHNVNFDLGRRHDNVKKIVKEERVVRYGDVLVNSTGTGTLGRVAQVKEELNEVVTVDSHVTIVRPNFELFFPKFFGYMMIQIEEKIKESGEGSVGQTELSRSVLSEKFTLVYPVDKKLQESLFSQLDFIEKTTNEIKSSLNKKLELLNKLKYSILTEAFNGELVKD